MTKRFITLIIVNIYTMKQVFRLSAATLCLLIISCHETPWTVKEGEYIIGAPASILPIMRLILSDIENQFPGVILEFEEVDSAIALEGVTGGRYTVSGSLYPPDQNSVTDHRLSFYPFARGGLIFIVNNQLPVYDLSFEQLRFIFTSQIENWQKVGGDDQPVMLVNYAADHMAYGMLGELLLDGDESGSNTLIVDRESSMVELISSMDNTIGYLSSDLYLSNLRTNGHIISVDGIKPTTNNVLDGSYPLSTGFYVVFSGSGEGIEWVIVDSLLSMTNQDRIRGSGLYSVR